MRWWYYYPNLFRSILILVAMVTFQSSTSVLEICHITFKNFRLNHLFNLQKVTKYDKYLMAISYNQIFFLTIMTKMMILIPKDQNMTIPPPGNLDKKNQNHLYFRKKKFYNPDQKKDHFNSFPSVDTYITFLPKVSFADK